MAHLTDDMQWSSDEKAVEQYLNVVCSMPVSRSRTDHKSKVHQLYQVAERLGAEVRIVQRIGQTEHRELVTA